MAGDPDERVAARRPSGALQHPEWENGRIDFQPYPYPSATKLIVESMNNTVVSGDTTFLNDLDPNFVAKDLVDYRYVRAALERYPLASLQHGVDPANPFEREEVIAL